MSFRCFTPTFLKNSEKFKNLFSSFFFSNLRFNRILLKRFYYEFSFYVLNKYSLDILSNNSVLLNHVLNFVFQLEAIQFLKINYSFFLSNFNYIHSISYINQSMLNYSKYFFDGLLNLFYSITRSVSLLAFFDFSYSSSFNLDLCLKGIFNDFLYRYRFLVTNFFFIEKYSIIFFRNLISRFNSNYLVRFFSLHSKLKFVQSTPLLYNFPSYFYSIKFAFYFPYDIFLNKLRTFGFFHTFLDRPIAFSAFIFKDDIYILNLYNSLIFSFVFWFLKISNYNEFYLFINFLRKSCLLTLSRKHKKSFSWALSNFTFDLTFFKAVSISTNLFLFSKKDLCYDDFSYLLASSSLNEVFFIYT